MSGLKRFKSVRGRRLWRVAFWFLILSMLLPVTAISADNPAALTAKPSTSTTALSAETTAPHLTRDGRSIVIIFLKEQPLHELSEEVKAEYAPRFEALRTQMRATAPKPWEGGSLTEEEEKEAVRSAPKPSAAEQAELDAMGAQVDALGTEMRQEMFDRAQPGLDASQEDLIQAIEELGGQVLYRYAIVNGVAAALPPEARAAIEARSDVAEVMDDQRMAGHLNVSGPAINVDTWWSAGYSGWNWDAAVVDSGIDRTHPGLENHAYCENRCLATADVMEPGVPVNDPTVDDVNGHGTHVAGIVASTDSTYRGMAYGLDMLFNCKAAFDEDGSDGGATGMYWSDAMSCVNWALRDSGCGDTPETVNLSYGVAAGADDSGFARFWDAVVNDLEVAATISAGNGGPSANTVEDPCIAYNVLCVADMNDNNTTTRSDDTISTTSSRGPTPGGRKKPDLAAPGTGILSANNTWEGTEANWVSYSGTTSAAPHVAGAQLLLTDYYNWTLAEPLIQKAVLINTADDWGDPEWDPIYGWGYIDLWEADFNKDNWFQESITPRPAYHLYKGYIANGEKATLVWERRAVFSGGNYPSTYYNLSDLDLYLYREDTGSQVDTSTSGINNVEQVQTSYTLYNAVVKVDAASASFAGASTETYALATEEGFVAVNGPSFTVGSPTYDVCVGNQWTVNLPVNNTGDVGAHNVQAALNIPTGLSLLSGGNPQGVGSIASGDSQAASWVFSASQGGDYTVPVNISSRSYAEDFAGSGSFSVSATAIPSTPSLIIPSDDSTVCDTTPAFDWSSVSGAISYQIQVDNNSNFSSPAIDTTTLSSNFTPSSSLAPNTYYWRVRASNGCGDSPWSAVWTVTVVVPPASAPGLVSPADGSSTCDTTPAFGWSSVSGATSYQIQVDDNSNFSSPLIDTTTSSTDYTPSSSLPPGTYYWRVRGSNTCGNSPWSAVRSVTILVSPSAPELVAPTNGSSVCDTTPTFEWESVSGATSYQIQVDDSPTFSSPEIDTTSSSPSFTPPSALSPGTYHWRVRGSNACGEGPWSATWSVTVLELPSTPSLITPTDGSSTCNAKPTFEWASVSGATSYQIQVDNNSNFSSPVIDTTTASPSFTPASALPSDTYYWRVRGVNPCGNGPWSSTWSVTVLLSPSAPDLLTPDNGGNACDTTPTFEWAPVNGVASYQIQVDNNSDFSSPEINTATSSPNYTPSLPLSPGTYYWRVRGSNVCGEGPWSAAWSVNILVLPLTPSLLAPPDGENTADTTPDFDWSTVSGATSYQIQVDNNSDFSSPQIDATTSDPNYTPASPLPSAAYYWRARASNYCGNSPWSGVRNLTVTALSRLYLPIVLRDYQ